MTQFVIDQSCIHGPVHSGNRASRQLFIEGCSLSDQCQAMSVFNQRLHLGGMRGARVVFEIHTGFSEKFLKPLMSIRMSLRVIQDCKIALQLIGLQRGFCCKRIVSSQAGNKPVSPQLLDT